MVKRKRTKGQTTMHKTLHCLLFILTCSLKCFSRYKGNNSFQKTASISNQVGNMQPVFFFCQYSAGLQLSIIALLPILGVTTKVQTYVQVQAENRLMVRLCDAAAQFPLLESIQGGTIHQWWWKLFHILILSGKKECLYRYDIA